MDSVTVFLIDANKLFREGMKRLFEGSPFVITGEAAKASEALDHLPATQGPQLILIDPADEAEDGAEALHALREAFPDTRLVILTTDLGARSLSATLGAGADGYLVKDIGCEALMQSLRLVLVGEKVFPTHLARLLVAGRRAEEGAETTASRKGLSQREVQILRCLLDGNTNKMIANQLSITEATVKVHLKSLLRKINASNRTQAAVWALNNGFSQWREKQRTMTGTA